MSRQRTPVLRKLWRASIRNEVTGCWLYNGGLDKDGYGKVYYMCSTMLAHRVSAILHLGLEPSSKLQANHKLICPNRNCWNPEHIYIGNQYQNMQDAMSAGTHVKFVGGRERGIIK